MGTFPIYSIGDSAFLEQILIAVAMISGAGDFGALARIGMLIGVLIIGFQSLFNGAKSVDWHMILIAWIFYGVGFGWTTTAVIEDAYTGEVRVVSNAPGGVVASYSILSNIGYRITDLFEQGFSYTSPSGPDNGFASSLQLLNQARRAGVNEGLFSALDSSLGGGYVDSRRTLENYIKECTLIGVDIGQKKSQEVMTQDWNEALRFNSGAWGTRVYMTPTNPDGSDVTCTDAWSAIQTVMHTSVSSSVVLAEWNRALSIDTSYGDTAVTKTDNALQSLGMVSTTGQKFIQAALLEPVYESAVIGKYQDFQDYSSALMVNQAIMQRNSQWSAEQSLFMTTVHPMMTFFEGFVFAITPIAVFAFMLASAGIKVAMKYMMVLLWIQLWMPIFAIINLYLNMSAGSEMSALSDSYSTGGVMSFYALNEIGNIAQSYLATGGMLASATPLISLFLISGSMYAFTSLAGRMSGGDHINEKLHSPDSVAPGPLVQGSSYAGYDSVQGMMKTGAESLAGAVRTTSGLASNVSSAEAAKLQASEGFQSALSNSVYSGASASEVASRTQALGSMVSSANTAETGAIMQTASDYAINPAFK